jgi:hypothetical protein
MYFNLILGQAVLNGVSCTYSNCNDNNPCIIGTCNNGYCCSSGSSQVINGRDLIILDENPHSPPHKTPSTLLEMGKHVARGATISASGKILKKIIRVLPNVFA